MRASKIQRIVTETILFVLIFFTFSSWKPNRIKYLGMTFLLDIQEATFCEHNEKE